MNCSVCGRNLKEDSRYCDFCGTKILRETNAEMEPVTFDTGVLLKWLLISVLVTAGITLIAKGIGIPLLFGGLFLPFFFKKKKQQ